jgi:SPFH domain / Band 7 family
MSKEKPLQLVNGYAMLAGVITVFLVSVGLFVGGVNLLGSQPNPNPVGGWFMGIGILLFVINLIACSGFVILLPNEAALLTLFGAYSGTARDSGFGWANPFMQKRKMSLRARNLEGGKLKVNDKQGNPIEIAAVVVWRVEDTSQAAFDVENFEEYVRIQGETAVRHLANSYAYYHGEDRPRRCDHGANGAARSQRSQCRTTRRGTQGVHGQQSPRRSLRRSGGASGDQHGDVVQLTLVPPLAA